MKVWFEGLVGRFGGEVWWGGLVGRFGGEVWWGGLVGRFGQKIWWSKNKKEESSTFIAISRAYFLTNPFFDQPIF
ncbi:hypothetical protein [Stieleria mannarensis]|uniref:hypothetical protein n=1 Tax=Stieleria mannarensis TaxID=2755585 RepID=UPI0016023E56|nr:hypothetical protein [Rhodopirellula sp. JC639]